MKHLSRFPGYFLALMLVLLAACATSQPTPTPVNPEVIYTQAWHTAVAILTETASAAQITPSATSTTTIAFTEQFTRTPLITNTPSVTNTPFAIRTPTTLPQQSCNYATYVRDIGLQDGDKVTAGSQFVKTWLMRNTGTCKWNINYTIAYGWGERMNGQDTKISREVNPGEEIEISVVMKAPTTPGGYGAYWRMRDDKLYFFGEYVSVWIIVP